MTPTFRIVANGADITELINDRLLLLRTTDKPGMESDEFELRIDDRDSAVSLPSREASVEVFLGYSGAALMSDPFRLGSHGRRLSASRISRCQLNTTDGALQHRLESMPGRHPKGHLLTDFKIPLPGSYYRLTTAELKAGSANTEVTFTVNYL